MGERMLRGSRLGAVSYESDRNTELAPRQTREYLCANGHQFEVPFAVATDSRASIRVPQPDRGWPSTGRPAPRLISKEMVASMRPGSVIVDLAVERGGNCELAKPGQVVEAGGVKIVGHLNVPGRIAASASSLYAKNLFAFLEILVDKSSRALNVKWDDEIVKATALTRDGAVIHPNFAPKSAA